MFLNLFFEQFIFDVHNQKCLEQPILIQIFSVTSTFYLMENFSVSKVCLKFSIFPPKNLEKIQAPKIRMRRFFFFLFPENTSTSPFIATIHISTLLINVSQQTQECCPLFDCDLYFFLEIFHSINNKTQVILLFYDFSIS